MKIETGVMIVKDGKAWGINYEDGRSTSYGWIPLEDAPIHNPRWTRTPESATYPGSPYVEQLKLGKIVHVERRTQVILKGES